VDNSAANGVSCACNDTDKAVLGIVLVFRMRILGTMRRTSLPSARYGEKCSLSSFPWTLIAILDSFVGNRSSLVSYSSVMEQEGRQIDTVVLFAGRHNVYL
jgi:NAD/NADP transhydrogenase beta subunit